MYLLYNERIEYKNGAMVKGFFFYLIYTFNRYIIAFTEHISSWNQNACIFPHWGFVPYYQYNIYRNMQYMRKAATTFFFNWNFFKNYSSWEYYWDYRDNQLILKLGVRSIKIFLPPKTINNLINMWKVKSKQIS